MSRGFKKRIKHIDAHLTEIEGWQEDYKKRGLKTSFFKLKDYYYLLRVKLADKIGRKHTS